jgi:hypothetical protein
VLWREYDSELERVERLSINQRLQEFHALPLERQVDFGYYTYAKTGDNYWVAEVAARQKLGKMYELVSKLRRDASDVHILASLKVMSLSTLAGPIAREPGLIEGVQQAYQRLSPWARQEAQEYLRLIGVPGA